MQYDIQDWLKFRGGGVLVPLGRFNINHDDNRWDLPRRSLVDRGVPVLPSTSAWDELGVGFLGDVPLTDDVLLNYQTYVVNGVTLDFEFEQIAQTRFPEPGKQVIEIELEPSTGTFVQDVKNAKAFTGRVALSPALGHEIGGSWYYGRYTPSFLPDENLWSLAARLEERLRAASSSRASTSSRTSAASATSRPASRASRATRRPSSRTRTSRPRSSSSSPTWRRNKQGYWLELRYRFWPEFLTKSFLGWEFDNPQLVAVLRGEQAWLERAGRGGATSPAAAWSTSRPTTGASTASRWASPTGRSRWSSSSSPTSGPRRTPARACRASPTSSPATRIT